MTREQLSEKIAASLEQDCVIFQNMSRTQIVAILLFGARHEELEKMNKASL